jgi:hypothetical protein
MYSEISSVLMHVFWKIRFYDVAKFANLIFVILHVSRKPSFLI